MCRSKTDPRGGYRCLPSSALIKQSNKNSSNPANPEYVQGAFWFNDSPETIEDIIETQKFVMNDNVMYKYLYSQGDPYTKQEMYPMRFRLVEEYSHLGNMIASQIDSRIPYFKSRILLIQEQMHEFSNNLMSNSSNTDKLKNSIANDSLKLGHELQVETRQVLNELNSNGGSFPDNSFRGHKNLKLLFHKHAEYFPKQWTSKLKTRKLVKFSNESFYSRNSRSKIIKYKGEFNIREGDDGIYYYSSINEAIDAHNEPSKEFYYRHEIVHELSHMFEQNSTLIKASTGHFLRSRITNKNGQALLIRESEDSKTYADSFAINAIGKIYRGDVDENEIFARGAESVLLGSNGSLIGLPSINNFNSSNFTISPTPSLIDIEHRNLTLGLLAGVKLEESI